MRKLIISALFSLLAINQAITQTAAQVVEDKLITTGFENIRVTTENNNFTISFENNIYRWNVRALATALDTIAKYVPENSSLNVVQLRLDIPQITTKVNAQNWMNFRNDTSYYEKIDSTLSVSYNTGPDWSKLKKTKPLNPNTFKFDLVFYPQLYLANLLFYEIYEVQFNIAPALQFSFWKGSQFIAQVIFPIYSNEKVYGQEGEKVRPGFLALSQNFRFGGAWFANVTVGNFNNHRYGIDFSLNHPFKNPRWNMSVNAGYTGSSYITDNGWEIGELNTLTFFAGVGYFWPRFNLMVDIKAGRFLEGDFGGRFDLTRMFGETTIGFYAQYSVTEIGGEDFPNAGFHFSIPFPPGKRCKHKTFRVNVPRYFDWEYNGATDFTHGRYYESKPNENRSEEYFNPIYIKEQLLMNRQY